MSERAFRPSTSTQAASPTRRDWRQAILGGGPGVGDRVLGYLFLVPAGLLIAVLVLYPFSQVILLGFYQKDTLSPEMEWVGLENFVAFFQEPDLQNALFNTAYWTVGSVVLELAVGSIVALVLHQQLRYRNLARGIVLFPYLLPTIVAVMVWKYMINDQVGILNRGIVAFGLADRIPVLLGDPAWAMPAVISIGVWKFFPFVVIAMLGILQSIPTERYEAAAVDGASSLQKFRYITVPAVLPVFLLTALLRTIWTFDKFDIIYQLTGGGPIDATTTMPIYVYYQAFQQFSQGRAAAVAMVMFFAMLTMMLIYTFWYDRAAERQS